MSSILLEVDFRIKGIFMQKNRFFFTCIVFLVFFAQAAWAGKIVDEAHIRSLLTKTDTIPVIVTFKVDKYQELAGKSAARTFTEASKGQSAPNPDAVLRTAIKGTADGLLQNLPANSFQHKRTFSFVPGIALFVNEAALQALANNPRVENIYENRPEKLPPIISEPTQSDLSKPHLSDSTPLVGADVAWAKGYTGAGQYVAILDTGVLTRHEMFSGKSFSEACFGTYASGTEPADYTSSPVCPSGDEVQITVGAAAPHAGDHGTHVAGIAAGSNSGSTAGVTTRGVAYQADIIAVQVFSEFISEGICGSPNPCYLSWPDDQIVALEHVYSLRASHSIAAVNMSLGGGAYSSHCDTDARKKIIDQLRSAGIATVIATGNNGYCGAISGPACISSAIAVGASDKSGIEAGYNNYHPTLQEFFAPGSGIYSAVTTGDAGYGFKSGTSMATPHVAGAIAVLKEAFPHAGVEDFEKMLRKSGTPLTGLCTGATSIPRINVAGAIDTNIFPWPAFMAAITGNASSAWGADNNVCCRSGWASFNLTAGGVTKNSVLSSCNTNIASWQGWQSSGRGNKEFTWTLTSDGCGSLSGSFNHNLEKDKHYQFYPSWTGSSVRINVRIFDAGTSPSQPQSSDTAGFQHFEIGDEALSLPFTNSTGTAGSWQQCSQP